MPISTMIIMPFAQDYNKLNRVWNIIAYVSLLVASLLVSRCNQMNIYANLRLLICMVSLSIHIEFK